MPNEQMATFWTDQAGPEWVANEQFFDHMLEPYGQAVLAALDLHAGQSVLDVGCGFGTTSIEAADQVGPGGRVVGVDISPVMVDRARERAAERDLKQVTFVVADAQVHHLDRPVDTLASRFGVMFFDDPVAAFSNLHSVVRPGGRLALVCWQSPELNPWVTAPLRAFAPHLPEPPSLPSPDTPGPFAFADPDRVTRILSASGWREVALGELRIHARLGSGRGVEGALRQMLATSTARAVRDQVPPDRWEQAIADLSALIAPHLDADGDVVFPAAAWLVTATR